ncbi:MAG: hypothetical protein JW384_03866 [Nitrosomonadaceae bacterium]|nr:hypothetical protein [Nitrosomonadaceae bacterium]
MFGPRPSHAEIKHMGKHGVDTIVTLLSPAENAKSLAPTVEHAKMEWLWLPISFRHEDMHPFIMADKAVRLVQVIKQRLSNKKTVFIHCAAGIDRTGMIGAAVMISCGMEPLETFKEWYTPGRSRLTSDRLDWAIKIAGEVQ